MTFVSLQLFIANFSPVTTFVYIFMMLFTE